MKSIFWIFTFSCLPILLIADGAISQNIVSQKGVAPRIYLLLKKKKNFVFLTSTVHTGNIGGLTGADNTCQNLATSAGLPGKYLAWLSDATESPADRFSKPNVPYVLTDGTMIATDWNDLTDGSLAAPINIDEKQQSYFLANVWSNTWSDGTQYDDRHHCDNWIEATPAVDVTSVGASYVTSSAWSQSNTLYNCNSSLRFYCFQQ